MATNIKECPINVTVSLKNKNGKLTVGEATLKDHDEITNCMSGESGAAPAEDAGAPVLSPVNDAMDRTPAEDAGAPVPANVAAAHGGKRRKKSRGRGKRGGRKSKRRSSKKARKSKKSKRRRGKKSKRRRRRK